MKLKSNERKEDTRKFYALWEVSLRRKNEKKKKAGKRFSEKDKERI